MVQYREGAADFQRVLDAQRSLLQQQNDLAQTASSVATNLIALYKALGGGWELREGQSVVPEQTQHRDEGTHQLGRHAVAPRTRTRTPRSGGVAMPKKISKRTLKWIIARGAGAGARSSASGSGWAGANALPDGIVAGNGRVEGKLVDVSAKEPLRVKEILVDEGALVKPNQVLVKLDTVTLEAQLAEARASVDAAEERLAVARASIVKQKSDIKLATVEADRSRPLLQEGAGSQRDLDVRGTKVRDHPGHPRRGRRDVADRRPRRSRRRRPTRRRSRRASTTPR